MKSLREVSTGCLRLLAEQVASQVDPDTICDHGDASQDICRDFHHKGGWGLALLLGLLLTRCQPSCIAGPALS